MLYYAIGRSLILQPGEGHWFTAKDPYHPMLPPQAGLYVLQVRTQVAVSCTCDTELSHISHFSMAKQAALIDAVILYLSQDTSPLAAPVGALPPLPEWPALTPAAQLVGTPDEASPATSPASSPGASVASSAAASLDDGGATAAGKGGPVTVDDIFGPVQTLSRAEEPAAAAANAAAKRAASKVWRAMRTLSFMQWKSGWRS